VVNFFNPWEGRVDEWEELEAEMFRIVVLLDEAGIPTDDTGKILLPSQRVEEALARLRARGGIK
jgi:hypothetical protein